MMRSPRSAVSVSIDTEWTGDVAFHTGKTGPTDKLQVIPGSAEQVLEFELLKNTQSARARHPQHEDSTSLEQEVSVAQAAESRTRTLIYSIMDDIRLGRSINSVEAKKAVAGMVESVVRNPDALVWLTQLKKKDEYTALHSLRVCILALTFGRHLGLSAEQLNVLGIGALLHDVGKFKVPNEILNKPARLTDAEYQIMKTHVPLGVEILENTPNIPPAAIEVARRHHERYSGSGYINGFSGDEIGLFGLVGAIVDTYDAITSDRAYHSGMSAYDALNLLYQARNTEYHTGLVEQFIQCMGVYPIGSVVEMNSGSVGVVISINRARRLKPRVALVLDPDKHPYTPAPVVDLFQSPVDGSGRVLEIRKVLPTGTYGIVPANYLPVSA